MVSQAGLDPEARRDIWALLFPSKTEAQQGTMQPVLSERNTLIITTHLLDEVRAAMQHLFGLYLHTASNIKLSIPRLRLYPVSRRRPKHSARPCLFCTTVS
jgi:hypothetical protein